MNNIDADPHIGSDVAGQENDAGRVSVPPENSLSGLSPDKSDDRLQTPMSDAEKLSVLKQERLRLKGVLTEKKEMLQKLKLIKMYRKKHDLVALQTLIDKWRTAAQEAASELHSKTEVNPRPPPLAAFLNAFHIDHKLIGFDVEEDSFS